MTISTQHSPNNNEVPIPKSITNVIPLPVELTAVAVSTICVAVPFVGWALGLTIAGGSTYLVKGCLYDAIVQPKMLHNSNVNDRKRTEAQQKAFGKLSKTMSIIIGATLIATCFKIINFIDSTYKLQCVSTNGQHNTTFLCSSASWAIIGTAGLCIASAGYLIKKLFD